MPRVLLVEDDPLISKSLQQTLRLDGFEVVWAASLKQARQLLGEAHMDLILLDLNLPDGDGTKLCRELRAEGSVLPILIVTANQGEEAAVRGIEGGANDYIRKPFGNRELLARIRSHLSLVKEKGKIVAYGALRIDLGERSASWDGNPFPLGRRELELLALLARRPESVVSREELIQQLDPDGELLDRSVDTHVSRLRAKLKAATSGELGITSVYGTGYRLVLSHEKKA